MVGTHDKIKVRKLYSHCMPTQFMHTCLIISLHGVVLCVVIIECANKYMCRCNNGENAKPPIHAAPQYVTMVARLAWFCSMTFNMTYVAVIARGVAYPV